jgi:hypothetical protein
MGETAPLLLTALGNDLFVEFNPGQRMSTPSLQIFSNAITGFKAAQARARAGALTLIILVLLFTIAARLLTAGDNVMAARITVESLILRRPRRLQPRQSRLRVQARHRPDRPVGLREVHPAALPERHALDRPGRPRRGRGPARGP